jgi:hypothetical protein
MKPIEGVWLSLEQVSQVLGLPWFTVFRWARSGDPRLPAYKIWDQTAPKLGRYRFKKQDVEALQTQDPAAHSTHDPSPVHLVSPALPGGPTQRRQRRSRLPAPAAAAADQREPAA